MILSWSRFDTPFGDGIVAWRDGRIARVVLPGRKMKADALARKFLADVEHREAANPKFARACAMFYREAVPTRYLVDQLEWPDSTEYQLAVLRACADIPTGETWTYGELAKAAGFPGSARAAGTVMATNPLPLIIPCHRIVRSGGEIGNYGGGVEMKRHLLRVEGALQPSMF